MRPIAEQCAALGWRIEELIGKTARQCRALGFEIPASVGDERTLVEATGLESVVDKSTHGHATGYAWLRPIDKRAAS